MLSLRSMLQQYRRKPQSPMTFVLNRNVRRASAASGYCRVGTVVAIVTGAVVIAMASGENTMVISHVFNGYTRHKEANGQYRNETYVFAKGGLLNEERIDGDTVNTIGFNEVARTVANALKAQDYVPGADADHIEQMIMLWYGTTADTQYDSSIRKFTDTPMNMKEKARILGWERDLSRAGSLMWADVGRTFLKEYNAGRYFVVLKSFDFQVARKEKRLKLLWESRFSIQRQGLDFTAELPDMANSAAITFGKETGGIIHREPPEGHVEIGDVEVVSEPAR